MNFLSFGPVNPVVKLIFSITLILFLLTCLYKLNTQNFSNINYSYMGTGYAYRDPATMKSSGASNSGATLRMLGTVLSQPRQGGRKTIYNEEIEDTMRHIQGDVQ